MIYEIGYPDRTYFELFSGAHPSKKIYSVQVKDWKERFSKPKYSKLQHEAYERPDILMYEPVPAVASEEPTRPMEKIDHLRVVPTDELIVFLRERGVELPDEIWVQPLAFDWEKSDEYTVEFGGEYDVLPPNKSNKTKKLLALAVAIVSLLN